MKGHSKLSSKTTGNPQSAKSSYGSSASVKEGSAKTFSTPKKK